jgi:hypothetical protein
MKSQEKPREITENDEYVKEQYREIDVNIGQIKIIN